MGSSSKSTLNLWLARSMLAAATLIGALVIAEAWVRHAMPLPTVALEGSLLRLSDNPALAYEYIPGKPPHNNRGFRDRDFGPKEPGVFRIAVMGDSIAYGFHTAMDETPAAAMQAALREASVRGADRWEVYNFGVEGYSVLNQAAQLDSHVLPHDPDIVFLIVCLNDWQPESVEFRSLLEQRDADVQAGFDPGLSAIRRALLGLHLYRHLRWRIAPPAQPSLESRGRPHPVHDPIEAHYEHRDFYGDAITGMAKRLRSRDIPFEVLLFPYDPTTRPEAIDLYRTRLTELEAHCEGGLCQVIDGLLALGLGEDEPPADAVFDSDDLHPTVHGSALLGQVMARRLLKRRQAAR